MSLFSLKNLSYYRFLPYIFATTFLITLNGCKEDESLVRAKIAPPEVMYNDGIDALQTHRFDLAAKEFEGLQQNFPYSGYVASAQIMESYAYYLQSKYPEAVRQINRFIGLHPTSQDIAYAYYLRALCFYEQISDVQRDQQGTLEAMNALEEVVIRFPQTKYARDAQLKIDLCRDHLAGKEMSIGRYYQQRRNYAAAINRYQRVVQDFQTTNHVPEALERMVEVYLDLGLVEQARKSAEVLGYNYPNNKWYHYAYDLLKDHHLLDKKLHLPGKLITASDVSLDTPSLTARKNTALPPEALDTKQQPIVKKAPVSPVKKESIPKL
ncbi:MAG: outer membrane protein assembly factor BamD [Acetobacter sp.]|nr:outer membrane protein assembly factor BamD [Acetobacter sp.]